MKAAEQGSSHLFLFTFFSATQLSNRHEFEEFTHSLMISNLNRYHQLQICKTLFLQGTICLSHRAIASGVCSQLFTGSD